jgi:hypothetical protein
LPFQTPITIAKALERIHTHEYVLPAIQREFVWDTDQVCALFDSLMRGYPIGSFLLWKVEGKNSDRFVFYDFIRNYHQLTAPHCPQLAVTPGQPVVAILDGQQRMTALNIALRGSHAEKLPWRRIKDPSAYPTRHLYLDLRHHGANDDLSLEYKFEFLSEAEAQVATQKPTDPPHWFRVRDILDMKPGPGMFKWLLNAGLNDSELAFELLDRLHEVISRDALISYYEEESQDLDRVLNIFIRVNSGGTVLSYSDLLLSIATAQWKDRDAREAIHGLVDELNATGQGFAFSKDLILKAGLVLMDQGDIRFKVDNFDKDTMQSMEAGWDAIANSLRIAVRLLSDFGFSDRTLTASSVLIPLAYYVHSRRLTETYLSRTADAEDRRTIRGWVIRSLLKGGVWGSGLDTLLSRLRQAIRDHGKDAFPEDAIEVEMVRLARPLRFEEAEIEDLLDSRFGSKRLFPLLALLYPGVDVRKEFHEDHVFPRARFTKRALLGEHVPESALPQYMNNVDRLPNLQLLEGSINIDKRAEMPLTWVTAQYPDEGPREAWLAANDLSGLPQSILDFPAFFATRRDRMKARLTRLLGAGETEADNAVTLQAQLQGGFAGAGMGDADFRS